MNEYVGAGTPEIIKRVEEVAKKRSRRTVKHQRGIVGADLAAIAARRNQTAAVRAQQRTAAIQKAKAEKKAKEDKKEKVKVCLQDPAIQKFSLHPIFLACARTRVVPAPRIEAGHEGWQGRPLKLYSHPPTSLFMTMLSTSPPCTKCISLACHHHDVMLSHAR